MTEDVIQIHGMLIDPDRRDAAWWTYGSSSTLVHTVYHEGRYADVRACGQMVIANVSSDDVITTEADLDAWGFATDAALDLIGQDGFPWEWRNNPWFEVFVDDESTGVIEHTVDDAINEAYRMLTEVAA
jgi:hypothetical protein